MENTKSYFILRYIVPLNYYRENVVMPSVMTLFVSRSQNCVLPLPVIYHY